MESPSKQIRAQKKAGRLTPTYWMVLWSSIRYYGHPLTKPPTAPPLAPLFYSPKEACQLPSGPGLADGQVVLFWNDTKGLLRA